MTWLSTLVFDTAQPSARALLTSPQSVHALVMGSLGSCAAGQRPLWRLDEDGDRAELVVLTTGIGDAAVPAPRWDHVPSEAYCAEQPRAQVSPYCLPDRLVSGGVYRFRTRINAVAATRNPARPSPVQAERLAAAGRVRGVVVPLRTGGEQARWMVSRAPGWGLEPLVRPDGQPWVDVLSTRRYRFSKKPSGPAVVLQTATLAGRVRVVDPDAARAAMVHGIGRARAYGCGLLWLDEVAQP